MHGVEVEMTTNIPSLKKPLVDELSSVSTMDSAKPQWMAHHEECLQLLRAVEELSKHIGMQDDRCWSIRISD